MMGYDYHIVYRGSAGDANEEDALARMTMGSDSNIDTAERVINARRRHDIGRDGCLLQVAISTVYIKQVSDI